MSYMLFKAENAAEMTAVVMIITDNTFCLKVYPLHFPPISLHIPI